MMDLRTSDGRTGRVELVKEKWTRVQLCVILGGGAVRRSGGRRYCAGRRAVTPYSVVDVCATAI